MIIKKFKRQLLYWWEFIITLFDCKYKSETDSLPKMLIVRLDAWGDYILFRNFIQAIRESEKYKGYQLTLLGNVGWKEFAESVDASFVDCFIWVNPTHVLHYISYRSQLLRDLNEDGYDVIWHPVYSRQFGIDALINKINAPTKLAVTGDARNTTQWMKRKSDTFYTTLIPSDDTIEFEFKRTIAIHQQLLGSHTISKPSLPRLERFAGLKIPYAVLFIDATDEYRRWPAKRFAKVARYITKELEMYVILTGRNVEMADQIINMTAGIMLVDLVGKTSMTQLASIIQDAAILIGNDTGAMHLGVAANVNTVCVSNGNHYGRFVPYDKEISKTIITVVPPEISESDASADELIEEYREGSLLDITTIKADEVIEVLKQKFNMCRAV